MKSSLCGCMAAAFCMFLFTQRINAQNTFPSTGSAGIGTASPNASSLLDMESTSKGLLVPRMTSTQRTAIALPAAGLLVYQTNGTKGFYYYTGTAWSALSPAGVNKTLSNLTAPTAVNVGLLPQTTNAINLGSASEIWENIYFGGKLFYGSNALLTIDTVHENLYTGLQSGVVNTTGSYNAGYGIGTLFSNTTGMANTAIGIGSLYYNTSGNYNTATGNHALVYNTSGMENTANGDNALYNNTTASYNTATGTVALYMNTTGMQNTANGDKALYNNSSGNYNTANGTIALYSNTTGIENTGTGVSTLYFNVAGSYNTATGTDAMYHGGANYSTATGVNALYYDQYGGYNTATGVNALYNNSTGVDNIGMGYEALYNNISGAYNIAIGDQALYTNNPKAQFAGTGDGNTAVGYQALLNATDGESYTAIGYSTIIDNDLYDVTAIGSSAHGTFNDQVRIGDAAVTSIGGYAGWTNISDGRVKKNIKQNVPGLAFINKLNPITYNLDLDAIDKIIQPQVHLDKDGKAIPPSQHELDARNNKQQIVYTGFIAQDVETAAKSLGYDFSGVDAAKNNKDLYGLRYADFVVPLVKAVQELNDSLAKTNASLQSQIDDLKSMVLALANKDGVNVTGNATLSSASLQQNVPNPYSSSTSIAYILPQTFTSAEIIITDNAGNTLKQVNVSSPGKGVLNIDASTFPAGSYNYSLMVDGKLIDTKKMVLAR